MQKFKTVVEPKNKLLDLKLKETLSYKDLIFLFVKRDFVAKYKQTILGPLWAIIQPLLTTLIHTFIFGTLASLPTFDVEWHSSYFVPSFLFFMSGQIVWSYISNTISATSNTFIANAAVMGKVYYPRLVSPIATSLSNFIQEGIQFLIFLAIWAYYLIFGGADIQITAWMLMLPVLVIQMFAISMGLGIILSSMTTKYRDLTMLIGFGLSLLAYLSPISYGLTLINNMPNWVQTVYMLNPFTNIVLTFRYAMFGFGYFNIWYYLSSWGFTLLFLFLGIISFNRIEKTFMDTI